MLPASIPTRDLYVSLRDNGWTCRKTLVEWYIKNLNQPFTADADGFYSLSDLGIEVVGAVPKKYSSIEQIEVVTPYYHLDSDSKIFLLSSSYKFVFGLDLSASVLRVDTLQPCAVLESLFLNLENCLWSLIQDFSEPEANLELCPKIYVSIFAQWHATSFKNANISGRHVQHKFLIHCCLLTKSSVKGLISEVREFIYNIKNTFAKEVVNPMSCYQQDILVELLKTGLSNFKHQKVNSRFNLVIISDGVVGMPDALALDKLVVDYHRHGISCFFVHVVPSDNDFCDFGCIPNVELMKYVAATTKGAYIESYDSLTSPSHSTVLQRTFLVKFLHNNLQLNASNPPLLRRKVQLERSVDLPFSILLRCRLVEGYQLQYASQEDDTVFVVLERLWWSNFTIIEYKIISESWPLPGPCRVEVYMRGTYEFIHDIVHGKKNTWTTSRKMVFQKFFQFIKDLPQGEHMFIYLSTFTTNQSRFLVPESMRKGQALFYQAQHSDPFVLSNSPKEVNTEFSSFWKLVLNLDVDLLHRWFHVHSVELILQPDIVSMTGFYTSNSDAQYNAITCNVSFNALTSMLRSLSDFILLHDQAFLKIIPRNTEGSDEQVDRESGDSDLDTPAGFMLLRLIDRHPLIVVKVAFLLGIDIKQRQQIVSDLVSKLNDISSPPTLNNVTTITRVRHPSSKSTNNSSTSARNSVNASSLGIVLQKPINDVLIRYDCCPGNLLTLNYLNDSEQSLRNFLNRYNKRTKNESCFYMYHKRCVWSIDDIGYAKTLAELLLRVRQGEGYHIAFSSSGIQNMVCEIANAQLNKENCGQKCCKCRYGSRHIQYIIFPPVIKDMESSFCASESEDDDADSVKFSASVKKSPENLLAAEICLDPQAMIFGDDNMKYPIDECLCKNLRSQYYNTVDMQRMADNIFAFDTICLSAVQTLETLKSMCASVDKEITLPTNCRLPVFSQNTVDGSPLLDGVLSFNVDDYDNVSDDGDELCEPNIVYYPTIFNFEGLLKNSSRVKMQFSLLEQENMSKASGSNDIVITSFNTSLKQHFDCEIVLNDAESNKITEVIFSRYCRGPISLLSKQAKSNKENMIKWKCYLKKGTELQTMVLFVPSTYQDFLNFLAISSDCKSSEDYKMTSSASSFAKATTTPGDSFPPYSDPNSSASLRVKRRISVKRFSVTESKTSGEVRDEIFFDENRTLSAFLFNCSMNKLVNAVLRNQCGFVRQDGVEWSETVEDFRINASDVFIGNHESCCPKKSFSASSEVHDSTTNPFFSPEQVFSDDVFPEKMKEKDTLNEMCGNVRDLFYRSFVSSVFTAVRSGGKIKVSNDDVEITTDFMCQEFVDEIDITEFLLYNCPQTVLFKAQHLKQSQPPTEKLNFVEESLKPRGSIIKPGKSILRSEVDTDDEMTVVSPQLDHQSIGTDQSTTPSTSTGSKILSFQSGGSAFMSFERASSTENKSVDMTTTTSASDSNDNPLEKKEQKAKSLRRNKMTMKPVAANSSVSDLCDSATTHQQCILTNGWNNLPEFSMSQLRSRSMSAASECVSRHFDNTINSFCSPVHSMPDLFYATSGQSSPGNENDSMMVMSNLDSEPECDFGTGKDNGHDLELFNNQHMSTYAKPSVSSSNECEFSSLDVYQDHMPLFLYMVCTVRDKKTGNHGSMPVSSLPTSLKTILKSFEKRCDTVDLSSLQITLDLIWIYVPDYEVMYSGDERPPAGCQYHIEKTRKTIKWLVEDELISTLSRCEPLSEGILEKITDHVKRSKSNNCHVARVPLRFIFGADKSRDLFSKEFEALRIADYRLRKVDGCYYWKYDLTFLPIKSVSAVGSTDELTNIDKPAAIKFRNHHSKSFQSLSCAKISVPEIEAEDDLSEAPSVIDLTSLAMNNADDKLPLHLARVKHKSSADNFEDGGIRYLSSPVSQQDGCNHTSSRHHSSSSKLRRSRSRRDTSASVPVTPTDLTNAAGGSHNIFSFEQPTVQRSQQRNKNMVVGHYALNKVLSNDTLMSPVSADSPSDVQRQMSCTSWLGSGYDGEGESDDEEGALSINCRCWQYCSGHFQDFLIMMRVKDDACILYLHSRASSNNSKNFLVESKRVFSQIKSNIRAACKSVNQVLLLTELNDTRKCQPLLVEEPTEQIWEKPSNDSNNRLAASLLFLPGHFACECRLKHVINLHHKLIDGHNGTTVPVAMTTVRAHLKSFSVLNQKDMFVFKVDDDNVFYCKIAVNFRLHDGRRSSVFFIDNDESDGVATTTPTHRSTPSQLKSSRKCQVHIHWYGVHAISGKNAEFIDDLKCSIQRKLEEVALDHLMIMLSRNPMFKLAPPDIDLIQPRKFDPNGKYMTLEPPTDKIIFSLPSRLVNSDMYSQFVYYLHQHIFQFLIAPRYTDSSSKVGQFLPYTEMHGHPHNVTTPPVPTPARKIYLYNAFSVASGRGGQGIACVSTDVLVSSKPATIGSNSPANNSDFWKDGEALAQSVVVDKTVVEDQNTFPELEAIKTRPIARFCIWRHGSMQIENLVQKLELALQHGLCDLVTEKFLCMPIKVTTLGPQPIRNFSMRNMCEEYETSKHLVAPPSMPPPSPVKEKQQECVLNEVYHTLLPEWLTRVIDVFKAPSVCSSKMECSCFSVMYSLIAPVIDELERTVPDVNVVCYMSAGGSKKWTIVNDLTIDEREERDQSACYIVIALGRRARIGQGFHTARISSFQKFVPHDPSLQRDSSPCPHDLVVKEYISRRNLIMVRFSANDMTVLMYNLAADKSNKLLKTLTEQVEFKENRHKFLQSLTFQKLGLFKAVPPLGKLTDGNKQPLSCRALIEDKRHARENNAHKIRAMMEDVYMNDQPTPITKHVVVETGDQLKMYGEQALAMNRRRRQLLEDLFHTQKFVLNSKCCGTSPSFKFPIKSFAIIFSYARLIYTVSCPIMVSKSFGGKDSAGASIPHESKPSRFLSKKSSTGEKVLVGKSDVRPSRKEIIASTLTFIKEELFRIYQYTWKDFKHIIFLSSSIHDVEAVPMKTDSAQSPAYFYRVMPDAVLILTIELEEEKCVAKLYIIEVPQHADRRVRHDINFIIHCCDLARSSGFQTLCFDLHINLLRKQLSSTDRTLMGHVLKNMLRHSEAYYSRLVDTTQRLQQMKIRHQVRSGVVKGRALYQFLVRNATSFGFGVVAGYDPSNSLLFTLSALKAREHQEECSIATHEKHDINVLLSKDHMCGCDDGKELCFIIHVIFTEKRADGDEPHRSSSDVVDRSQSEMAMTFRRIQASLDISCARRKPVDIRNDEERKAEANAIRKCEMQRTRSEVVKLMARVENECERSHLYNTMMALARDRSTIQNNSIKAELRRLIEVSRVSSASTFDPSIDSLISEVKFDRDRFLKRFSKFAHFYVVNDNLGKRICVFPQQQTTAYVTSPSVVHADVMVLIQVNLANAVTTFNVVWPSKDSYVSDVELCRKVAHSLLQQILNEFFNLALLQRLL